MLITSVLALILAAVIVFSDWLPPMNFIGNLDFPQRQQKYNKIIFGLSYALFLVFFIEVVLGMIT